MTSRAPQLRRDRGFTLAELLVVLTILAILTTVAVQSLSPVAEQARYDATQRTMQQIRAALLGRESAASSVEAAAGFVANLGRFPLVTGTDPLVTPMNPNPNALHELLVNLNNEPLLGWQSADPSDGQLKILRGWGGSYLLSAPNGVSSIADGWGKDLSLTIVDGVMSITSSKPEVRPLAIPATEWHGRMITGVVQRINSKKELVAPYDNDMDFSEWKVKLVAPDKTIDATMTPVGDQLYYTFQFSEEPNNPLKTDLSIGPRVLRIYQGTTPKGQPLFITVRPNATQTINIFIPDEEPEA